MKTSHEIWREVVAEENYATMWCEVASRYRKRASVAGYDLMVEPTRIRKRFKYACR
jgi:hypothetical protein